MSSFCRGLVAGFSMRVKEVWHFCDVVGVNSISRLAGILTIHQDHLSGRPAQHSIGMAWHIIQFLGCMWLTLFHVPGVTTYEITHIVSSDKVRACWFRDMPQWNIGTEIQQIAKTEPQKCETSSILGFCMTMKPKRVWDFGDPKLKLDDFLGMWHCGCFIALRLGRSKQNKRSFCLRLSVAPSELYASLFDVRYCVLGRSIMGGDAIVSILTEQYVRT